MRGTSPGPAHPTRHHGNVLTAAPVSACRAAWHSSTHHPTAPSNRCSRRASNTAAAADTLATSTVQQSQSMLCTSTARLQRSSCGCRSRRRAGGRWWQQWLPLAQQRRGSSCQGPCRQCGLCNGGPCKASASRTDTSTTGAAAHAPTHALAWGKRTDSSKLCLQTQLQCWPRFQAVGVCVPISHHWALFVRRLTCRWKCYGPRLH